MHESIFCQLLRLNLISRIYVIVSQSKSPQEIVMTLACILCTGSTFFPGKGSPSRPKKGNLSIWMRVRGSRRRQLNDHQHSCASWLGSQVRGKSSRNLDQSRVEFTLTFHHTITFFYTTFAGFFLSFFFVFFFFFFFFWEQWSDNFSSPCFCVVVHVRVRQTRKWNLPAIWGVWEMSW